MSGHDERNAKTFRKPWAHRADAAGTYRPPHVALRRRPLPEGMTPLDMLRF